MSFIIFKNGRIYIRRRVRVVRKVRVPMLKHTPTQRKALAEQARAIVHEKVELYAGRYGVTYGRISIRNQQTRWGSCSTKGNLNFNYRIALLPTELQDYLIVHELCHLLQMNHSKKFWDLVAQQIPDYKALNKKLKTYSLK